MSQLRRITAPMSRIVPLILPLFFLIIASKAAPLARPSLLPYDPAPNPKSVVLDSSGTARFTVLTDRLIRMQQRGSRAQAFEDRSTLAFLNRNLPAPAFQSDEKDGILTISTKYATLRYTVGQPFSAATLSVKSDNQDFAWAWSFGDDNSGNLLGTIRGLDRQDATPLNCSLNARMDDNGEFNHCEWGLISRDGWSIVDDTRNFCLDPNDWWSDTGTPKSCDAPLQADVNFPKNSATYPSGTKAASVETCCGICSADPDCRAGAVFSSPADDINCWPLQGYGGYTLNSTRTLIPVSNPQQNTDDHDLYGFFHGRDYRAAINDFVAVSGRTIMVPRWASGVWWSRWFDFSNADVLASVRRHDELGIPLDVFVLDMNWHQKNDWTGFTFDSHLFPYPSDTMAVLHAMGLGVTVNVHDNSGVNSFEKQFKPLAQALGLPPSQTNAELNLRNDTWAYAVEDIVIGDIVKQGVDFFWIDWQQGGSQGGLSGDKQNPTMWLNHLRCTDRHRNGDDTRALVLARWGGLGGHRYQVGFSGDVKELTWSNLAYQPYFSVTAANVAHGYWSHDIEGPGDDMEMYTRWIQAGAFSGVMRSHDRGMSAGDCDNTQPSTCSVVQPWKVPPAFLPANVAALQAREELLPYIYSQARAAFDTGVGLIIPMYYDYPTFEEAYLTDASGTFSQYMFGPSILVAPIVNQGQTFLGGGFLTSKTVWLPPGVWYSTVSGDIIQSSSILVTKNYTLDEVPLWCAALFCYELIFCFLFFQMVCCRYRAGAVIPFLPLRHLPVVGLASKSYSFLGFRIAPGAESGSGSVYEDDGSTTAYLNGHYGYTTLEYTRFSSSSFNALISPSVNSSGSMALRSYQVTSYVLLYLLGLVKHDL